MRTKAQNSVGIHDLVVADFRTENMQDQVRQWRISNHVPYAESCARQIWFGSTQAFETFPSDKIHGHSYTLHHGANAYQHLMRLNLGLLSRQFGETNIAGQFYNGWAEMHKTYPEKAKPYDTLVQQLTNDTRLIRGLIMPDWKMKVHELAARDLSGMQNQDSVLVIGHLTEKGHISPMTDMLVRKLTSNENMRAREVLITHPDPQTKNKLLEELKGLKDSKRIRGDVSAFDFDDLSVAFELYDRVYITMPMGLNPEADQTIINAWKGRNAEENTITHLRAPAENMAASLKPWIIADLDNYTSPEDIREEMVKRERNNTKLAQDAENTILKCIQLRLQGLQPSRKTLDAVADAPPPQPNCG